MRSEGLLRQKEQYGRRCVNNKGKAGDPSTVKYWRKTVGNKTTKERRGHLDCLAPLGKPLNIFSRRKIIQSKRDGARRNSMKPLENKLNPEQ